MKILRLTKRILRHPTLLTYKTIYKLVNRIAFDFYQDLEIRWEKTFTPN